jgi:N-sulfoglucosamine sulfohydrolase
MKKLLCSSIILGFLLHVNAQKTPVKYNVLWLDMEDLSPHLACYGDSTIQTPNIDRLAKEGVIFTKAYACAGVCAPSRVSIITGMYPTALGAHNMRVLAEHKYPNVPKYEVVPPAEVRCFPDILREYGVYTIASKKSDYQFSPSPFTWDELTKNDEVDRYQIPVQRPFFKQINFWETHESQIWSWMRENVPLKVDTSKVKVPPYLPQTPTMKLDWAAQYNNLLFTDAKIGKIIKALEDAGQLDKTIIVLSGDHGDGLPRSKRTVYESGVRVPLIVRFPDMKMAGKRIEDLVYLMDLGPTILSFYNISIPGYMNGRNVFADNQEARTFAFFSADRFDDKYDIIRAVTDGKYKYIRNFQPQKPPFMNLAFRKAQAGVRELYLQDSLGKLNEIQQLTMRKTKPMEELYDLQNDPFEIRNLAQKSGNEQILIKLRTVLDNWMRETKDLGFTPENELAEMFWPNGKQPLTALPSIEKNGKQTSLSCTTPGATIGYRTKAKDPWKIYSKSVEISPKDSLYVMAHRLGFRTSETVKLLNK